MELQPFFVFLANGLCDFGQAFWFLLPLFPPLKKHISLAGSLTSSQEYQGLKPLVPCTRALHEVMRDNYPFTTIRLVQHLVTH